MSIQLTTLQLSMTIYRKEARVRADGHKQQRAGGQVRRESTKRVQKREGGRTDTDRSEGMDGQMQSITRGQTDGHGQERRGGETNADQSEAGRWMCTADGQTRTGSRGPADVYRSERVADAYRSGGGVQEREGRRTDADRTKGADRSKGAGGRGQEQAGRRTWRWTSGRTWRGGRRIGGYGHEQGCGYGHAGSEGMGNNPMVRTKAGQEVHQCGQVRLAP
ncbi:hypothetical protein C8Q76DRAFT_735853 [Earliella scabrosa]|nr:hypothetical protein C8Q76DRAFT_735853 [Earliella scabrosa]